MVVYRGSSLKENITFLVFFTFLSVQALSWQNIKKSYPIWCSRPEVMRVHTFQIWHGDTLNVEKGHRLLFLTAITDIILTHERCRRQHLVKTKKILIVNSLNSPTNKFGCLNVAFTYRTVIRLGWQNIYKDDWLWSGWWNS